MRDLTKITDNVIAFKLAQEEKNNFLKLLENEEEGKKIYKKIANILGKDIKEEFSRLIFFQVENIMKDIIVFFTDDPMSCSLVQIFFSVFSASEMRDYDAARKIYQNLYKIIKNNKDDDEFFDMAFDLINNVSDYILLKTPSINVLSSPTSFFNFFIDIIADNIIDAIDFMIYGKEEEVLMTFFDKEKKKNKKNKKNKPNIEISDTFIFSGSLNDILSYCENEKINGKIYKGVSRYYIETNNPKMNIIDFLKSEKNEEINGKEYIGEIKGE